MKKVNIYLLLFYDEEFKIIEEIRKIKIKNSWWMKINLYFCTPVSMFFEYDCR